ncbi:unnamed protein product [Toxocara canis]|uniref:DNA-directed DNA polymerase n=1 Tax=Toxocara canis TaxID=6265 RepID=A0A183UZX1_TOXCA|nr:unnamed protein product [Toxocara canis]
MDYDLQLCAADLGILRRFSPSNIATTIFTIPGCLCHPAQLDPQRLKGKFCQWMSTTLEAGGEKTANDGQALLSVLLEFNRRFSL